MLDRESAQTYAGWFRALADPTRVQILNLLAAGAPLTVGQLVDQVAVGQSTVSAHLKVLTEARFVLAESRGTARFYQVNQRCVAGLAAAADVVMAGPRPAVPAGSAIRIVPATEDHADAILAIYQAGLDTGEASFETTAPDWATWDATRMRSHRFVALDDTDRVLGWIAVTPVSSRCVYAGVVEHSVYVDPGAHGRGVGIALLNRLIASTEADGIWTIQSGIFPENTASLALHRRAGFREVGIRERVGAHHGRWRDVVLVERRSQR
ncbi:helix-turn-helix domain-containing GNAT family N-acetyltransferase [Amycolatopsis sp. NPDC059657]|uniref:helix-turn-helix domain-containing GNAT family N-acetyltransferase n=1 Tax=Amycolatopsis sp. NPDC059657 TaxID=3346899 RepID=UPI00366F0F1D